MHLIKITKAPDAISTEVYKSDLSLVSSRTFEDMQTLNFYLQAIGEQNKIGESVAVIHDRQMNSVALRLLPSSDSLYID